MVGFHRTDTMNIFEYQSRVVCQLSKKTKGMNLAWKNQPYIFSAEVKLRLAYTLKAEGVNLLSKQYIHKEKDSSYIGRHLKAVKKDPQKSNNGFSTHAVGTKQNVPKRLNWSQWKQYIYITFHDQQGRTWDIHSSAL